MDKRQIRDISKNFYKTTYEMLVKKAKSEDLTKLYTFISKEKLKRSTIRNHLNAVICYYKQEGLEDVKLNKLKKLRDVINTEIKKKYENGDNLTDNQKSALDVLTIEKLEDLVDKLRNSRTESRLSFEKYLILAILTEIHLRNDIKDLKIVKNLKGLDDKQNYLYINKTNQVQVIINYHKTSSVYGTIEQKLSVELSNDIKQFIKLYPDRTYLFEKAPGVALTSHAISDRLIALFQKEFKINATSTTIRKLFTSKYSKEFKAIKEESKMQGHSLQVASNIYTN